MADGGYDVADYRDIEPLFGTLADADALIGEAHDLGLRVIVDIVPNHSSDQHAWFQAALAAGPGQPGAGALRLPAGARRRRRASRRTTGSRPSAGRPGPGCPTASWYLHLFAPEQPDLDWENPEVVAEFEDILRFWLDRGVDGFRIDVAHALKKDQSLPRRRRRGRERRARAGRGAAPPVLGPRRRARDLPRLAPGRSTSTPATGCSSPRPGSTARTGWPATCGPTSCTRRSTSTSSAPPGTPTSCARPSTAAGAAAGSVGAPTTWVLSNHDVTRHATRYGRLDSTGGGVTDEARVGPDTPLDPALGLRRARAATLLLLALPGSAYVYQGEELGLPEVVDLPGGRAGRPDLGALGPHACAAGTAAGCRSRGPGPARRFGFGAGDAVAAAAGRLGRAVGRGAGGRRRARPSSSTGSALRLRRELLHGEDLEWVDGAGRDAAVPPQGDDGSCGRLPGEPRVRAGAAAGVRRGPGRQRTARRRRAPGRHRRLAPAS